MVLRIYESGDTRGLFLMRNAYSYLSSIKNAAGNDRDEQACTQRYHVTPPAPARNHEMIIMTSPPFSIFSPVNIFKSHNKIITKVFPYRVMVPSNINSLITMSKD